ncbi:MAG: PilZ domain-containing protein [Pseudomonadota bacterium]
MKQRQSLAVNEPSQIEAVLQVGLQVIVQKEVGQERIWAKVVGWLPEGAVILDGPAQWVSLGQLFAQNRLLVRFISLGSFYGFATRVITVLKAPLLVVLEWPKQLDKVPLSSETRCVVNVPVQIAPLNRDGSPGVQGEALLADLSRRGCQARGRRGDLAAADLSPGRLVRLTVSVPTFPQALEVAAQIRNTQVTGGEVVMGLRFEEGQTRTLERLQLVLAPMLRLGGENWGAPAASEPEPAPPAPPAPLAPSAPAGKIAPSLPLDKQPLHGRPPEPSDGPRVFAVPEELRVDTTATKVRLDEMTAERAAAILGVRALGGSLSAVLKARELVRAWVEKYGEFAVRERRRLLLRDCATIQGLKLIK